jgi:hypothetical protein
MLCGVSAISDEVPPVLGGSVRGGKRRFSWLHEMLRQPPNAEEEPTIFFASDCRACWVQVRQENGSFIQERCRRGHEEFSVSPKRAFA